MDHFTEHGSGAILGALIGDAAGATLEFLGRMPVSQDVQQALSMVGGGVWRTAPGQITDDGEMTLALCQALAEHGDYLPNQVARNYRAWRLSSPFDIGIGTAMALAKGELHDLHLDEIIRANAAEHNEELLGNGCLMRATPLAVWSAGVSLETAIATAQLDASLTHPGWRCLWATVAYVVAIRHLLLNPGDNRGAFDLAEEIQPRHEDNIRIMMSDIREGKDRCNSTLQAGYVLIGLEHAFHHLYHATPFVEAMNEVLLAGGDTDTNACITGGMLGALWGRDHLPPAMLDAVLNCDVSRGQARPRWLQTRHAMPWIDRFLEAVRSQLEEKRP